MLSTTTRSNSQSDHGGSKQAIQATASDLQPYTDPTTLAAACAAQGGNKMANTKMAQPGVLENLGHNAEVAKDQIVEKVCDTEEQILDKSSDAKDSLSRKAKQGKEHVSDKVHEVKKGVSDKVSELKENISDKAHRVKEGLSEAIDTVKEQVSKHL